MKSRVKINLEQNQEFQCGRGKFETWRCLVGTCAYMSLTKM